jgi:hypothetical protein
MPESFGSVKIAFAVDVLILKSAVQLAVETVRSLANEEVHLSRLRMTDATQRKDSRVGGN